MGRTRIIVSKGVKDLSSCCVEQKKGVRSREAWEEQISPRSERGLGQAKDAQIRSGVGRSPGGQGAPSTTEMDEFPANPWALESTD